jgi:formylglycine-generating enzyme required for sulfatase activity
MRLLAISLVCLGAFASGPDEMVTVPGGEFTMGRTKLTSDDKTNMRPHVLLDDRPAHKVTVSSFRLDRHEVTNRQYEVFLKSTNNPAPYHWVGGRYAEDAAEVPVYNVSWTEANAYCAWAGKRLPTEAEWEHAARGAKESMDYPWGDQASPKQARFNVTTGPGPVAKFPPSDFGVFDMAGNVAEWTADWFDGEYYKRNENTDPKGPLTGDYKVIRGGAWSDSPRRITVFFRNWVRPTQRTPNIGFRCAQ